MLVRVWYFITYPWHAYKAFFYMLGSNPGKGIQAHEKILINGLAGIAVFIWTFYLAGWQSPGTIYFPFEISVEIGLLMLPFIVLTVLVMSNAVNIADGMDGLSAGMLLPGFTAFMAIALLRNDPNMALLCATAIGGLIAYIYFNIPPARVQMGDVGSLSMGTLMAVIALEMRIPFLLLVIGFPFILEFASSLLQGIARRLIGRRLLMMAPLHHHFELIDLLTNTRVPIHSTRGWNEAEFTAGGIAVDEVDAATLQSKIRKNLYFCGEILDVDGDVGGFNLSWAWSSGFVAGKLA